MKHARQCVEVANEVIVRSDVVDVAEIDGFTKRDADVRERHVVLADAVERRHPDEKKRPVLISATHAPPPMLAFRSMLKRPDAPRSTASTACRLTSRTCGSSTVF